MASIIVDDIDPRFTYKSTWIAGGLQEEFNGTHHATSVPGAQVIFGPFSGTSISVFGTIGDTQPTIHYFVDSDQQDQDERVPSELTPQFRQLLYHASNLDGNSPHTLQVNQLDSGAFTLDFVEIGQSSAPSPAPSTFPQATTTTSFLLPSNPPSSIVISFTTSASSPKAILSSTLSETNTPPSFNISRPMSTGSDSSTSRGMTATPFTSNRAFIAVICAVVGGFVVVACIAGILVWRSRQRLTSRRTGRRSTKPTIEDRFSSSPLERPPLRLRIPDVPSLSRDPGTSSSMPPVYSNPVTDSSADLPSSSKQVLHDHPENDSQGDLNSDPVFDIKQRPVSGTTMTTRVTVGTNIGSIPDEIPEPVPSLPNFPPELMSTGLSWPTNTSDSNAASWTNYSFNLGTNLTGVTGATSETSWITPRPTSRDAPSPRPSPKPMVHNDAGVRLDANLPSPSFSRLDLPPPYQNFS